jgi:hypothetical protein
MEKYLKFSFEKCSVSGLLIGHHYILLFRFNCGIILVHKDEDIPKQKVRDGD